MKLLKSYTSTISAFGNISLFQLLFFRATLRISKWSRTDATLVNPSSFGGCVRGKTGIHSGFGSEFMNFTRLSHEDVQRSLCREDSISLSNMSGWTCDPALSVSVNKHHSLAAVKFYAILFCWFYFHSGATIQWASILMTDK